MIDSHVIFIPQIPWRLEEMWRARRCCVMPPRLISLAIDKNLLHTLSFVMSNFYLNYLIRAISRSCDLSFCLLCKIIASGTHLHLKSTLPLLMFLLSPLMQGCQGDLVHSSFTSCALSWWFRWPLLPNVWQTLPSSSTPLSPWSYCDGCYSSGS